MEYCAEYGVIFFSLKFEAVICFIYFHFFLFFIFDPPRDAQQGCHLLNKLFTEFCGALQLGKM